MKRGEKPGRLDKKRGGRRWGREGKQLIKERRGGAMNRVKGLMAETTAGSFEVGGPINKRVTAINIV